MSDDAPTFQPSTAGIARHPAMLLDRSLHLRQSCGMRMTRKSPCSLFIADVVLVNAFVSVVRQTLDIISDDCRPFQSIPSSPSASFTLDGLVGISLVTPPLERPPPETSHSAALFLVKYQSNLTVELGFDAEQIPAEVAEKILSATLERATEEQFPMFQVLQSMARDAPSASVSEVQIHYKADPLPITPEETLACLPHNQALPPQRIVSILQRFVVKAGSSSVAAEAQNMLLVQKHTTIPVPAVYLVFSQGPWTYLVMQQISGQNADIAWPDLDAEDRAAVFSQLAGYVDQLRAIPPPQDLSPGPPGGGRCEGRYFSFYGAGPFKTADDLVAWMNYKLAAGSHPSSSLFVPDPTLVFTHQDIALRNLILEPDVQSGRTRVWLIDWEQAAWLPPYFEGASAVTETGAQGWVPISWTEGMKEMFGFPDFTREWDLLERLRGVLSSSPF